MMLRDHSQPCDHLKEYHFNGGGWQCGRLSCLGGVEPQDEAIENAHARILKARLDDIEARAAIYDDI